MSSLEERETLENWVHLSPVKALLQHTPEGICIITRDSPLVLLSIHAQEQFKTQFDQRGGLPLARQDDLVAFFRKPEGETDFSKEFPLFRSLRSGEVILKEEWILCSKLKEERAILINSGPILGEEGAITGATASWHDIQELILANEKLLYLKENLERQVHVRTQELQSAKEEAQAANRAKTRFLDNLSHEFRTPLSEMLGSAAMLLESASQEKLSKEAQATIKTIRSSVTSMLGTIGDLLELSSLERGTLQIRPTKCDLLSLLGKIVNLYETRARRKNIVFKSHIGEGLPERILCDSERVFQILSVLLSNAIKFTDEGEAGLEVRWTDKSADLVEIEFAVTDSGIGIPPDRQDQIFTSFVQLEDSFDKRYQGLGVGLSLASRLVQKMGGTLHVQSRKTQGSSFIFRAEFRRSESGEEPEGGFSPSLRDIPPLKILLAEDNVINRMYMERTLTQSGHQVVTAEHGREVLQKLDRDVDAVLMDIQMPGMDGLEATRRIRSADGERFNPAIPIIAVTAFARKGDRDRFLEQGMDGYLPKPLDFNELARLLLQCMQKTKDRK